jgi:AraC-like DNA-binding protein
MYTEPIDKSLMTQGLLVFEQDSNPDTAFLNKPFRSQYFAFFVIRRGSITFNINFREYNFGPREVIFLPPVVVSECKYISSDCSFIGMAFTGEFLQKTGLYLNSTEALDILVGNDQSPSMLITKEEYDNVCSMLTFLHNKLTQPDTQWRRHILDNAFRTLMFELTSIHSKIVDKKRPPLTSGENITLQFIKLLGSHYKAQRSVQFYADAMHLTARHLSQVLKEITGQTAGQLIDEAVMMEARILLANPAFNVTQIAEMLHFSNASVFGKYFKQQAGASPTAYRDENPESHISTNNSNLPTL